MADDIRGFRLGDRIKFDAALVRTEGDPKNGEVYRWWTSVPRVGEGIVVGHRVMRNGKVVEESDYNEFSGRYYSWMEFKQTGSVPCLLVATDMRRKHVRVPFHAITDHVTEEDGGE